MEKAFRETKGVGVKWVEFTSGPPLVEAMNVGSDRCRCGRATRRRSLGRPPASAIVYVAALLAEHQR